MNYTHTAQQFLLRFEEACPDLRMTLGEQRKLMEMLDLREKELLGCVVKKIIHDFKVEV